MTCPECKGTGEVVLLTSVEKCKKCETDKIKFIDCMYEYVATNKKRIRDYIGERMKELEREMK